MTHIAIIGAGLAGLTLANLLKDDFAITVFEKSRGVSGRIATRRADTLRFDHGAQFFTVHSEEFKTFLEPLMQKNIIQRWDARFVEFVGAEIVSQRQWNDAPAHYVGVPGMNAIGKYLANDVNIRLQTEISRLEYDGKWQLFTSSNESLGHFDWVIMTAPAPQTVRLLPMNTNFRDAISDIKMQACYSLMLSFANTLTLDFETALVRDADISWISVNSAKPERGGQTCLLVHSSNHWADQHIDLDDSIVIEHLCQETSRIMGISAAQADYQAVHRWRYANIQKQAEPAYYLDTQQHIAACGDWCIHGRIEAAFLSALALTNTLKTTL